MKKYRKKYSRRDALKIMGTGGVGMALSPSPLLGNDKGGIYSDKSIMQHTGYSPSAFGQEAFKVTVNGATSTAYTPYYPIYPGRANRLTIYSDPAPLGQGALTVTLARVAPDGRADQATAKLSAEHPEAVFDLGAFAVPAEYEYEHGIVYRRGYRFKLIVTGEGGKNVAMFDYYQGPASTADSEALWVGNVYRYVHQIGFERGLPLPAQPWTRHSDVTQPMDPPFLLQLNWSVLFDPDDVHVQFRQKNGLELAAVPAELVVTRLHDGQVLMQREVTIGPDLATEKVDVSGYEEGAYRLDLRPSVPDTTDREGPRLVYRRTTRDPSDVLVSPLAPWTLKRDFTRNEVIISDFQDAVRRWGEVPNAEKWDVGKRLQGRGDIWAEPVVLRPSLKGYYAVFAATVEGKPREARSHIDTPPRREPGEGMCFLEVGKDAIVRRLGAIMPQVSQTGDQFLVATDMTGGSVSIYQSGAEGQGLASLRLVPVTAGSVATFEAATSNPPTPLAGICEWLDFFLPGEEPRRAVDQWETLVKGHAELGMRDLQWSVGRSVLLYESRLPNATRWPAVPLDQVDKVAPHWPTWDYMNNEYCALTEAEKYRDRHGVRLWPHLCMQRHYGVTAHGGVFRSEWFASNPRWRRWHKRSSAPDGGQVSFFFPEVREERVDILCELAERDEVHGLHLDCNRQVPMLLYHPEMVTAYKEKTGVDPQTIDASAGKIYEDWIRWRADFFTETLRELQARLAPIRERRGEAIPVVVRIPSAGLLYSMAKGLNVETWCCEGLIDELQLEPLETRGERGSHDVRPYIELGRRYNIIVWGGINANTFDYYTVIMKRAMGLLDAGVDGIFFYESNQFSGQDHLRWIVPLAGNRKLLAEFLETSNIEACFPVRASEAFAGFDNHSFRGNYNVYDSPGRSL